MKLLTTKSVPAIIAKMARVLDVHPPSNRLMQIKHTYSHNSFGNDSTEEYPTESMTLEQFKSIADFDLADIKSGVEISIDITEGFPTICRSHKGGEHCHFYQVIKE
jgi:hypothetical protein